MPFHIAERFCMWTTARLVRNKGPCKWNDWRYEKQLTLQVSVSFMKTHSVQWGKNIERLKFERWHGKWSFTFSVIYTIELLVNVLSQMVREPRHTCLLFPFIIKVCWHMCMFFARQQVLKCVHYTLAHTRSLSFLWKQSTLDSSGKLRANIRRWRKEST